MPRCCWGCDGTFPIFVSETHLQDNPNMRIYILMGCINSDGKLLMVFICRLLLLLWGVATASTLKKNEPLTKTAKNGHKNRCHKNSDDSLSCGWTCNYRASPTTKTVEKAHFAFSALQNATVITFKFTKSERSWKKKWSITDETTWVAGKLIFSCSRASVVWQTTLDHSLCSQANVLDMQAGHRWKTDGQSD